MIDLPAGCRPATPDDADALAQLVNLAGEGLPLHLWERMAAPGQSPWDVGRARARRDTGGFSWRNAIVCEADGGAVACLIGYPLADAPEPVDHDEVPPMFVPLQQLEDQAPGTWYVNVLATRPGFRGRGYGSILLQVAERCARASDRHGLSVIVADTNAGARRLYERHGYREVDSRPVVKEDWDGAAQRWLLLTRAIEPARAT